MAFVLVSCEVSRGEVVVPSSSHRRARFKSQYVDPEGCVINIPLRRRHLRVLICLTLLFLGWPEAVTNFKKEGTSGNGINKLAKVTDGTTSDVTNFQSRLERITDLLV